MLSVNSYFNRTLFLKNIKRFWPLWFAMTLFWFTTYPSNVFLQTEHWYAAYVGLDVATYWGQIHLIDIIENYTPFVSAFVGLIAAMAVFSYLFNNKATNTLHGLPIRREGLFLTNYLSGLALMYIPLVVNFVLALIAHGMMGGLHLPTLLTWFLAQVAALLFFYSFAVFCAMFTGHILALPIFYGILNFLASYVTMMISTILLNFLYGYSYSTPQWLEWLCPVLKLSNSLYSYDGLTIRTVGIFCLVIYAIVGLVLTALSLLIYRHRHLERAGDVVVVHQVYPLFRTGVSFCSALFFGSLFFQMFYSSINNDELFFTALFCVWGLMGYFVAEMFLRKSFRVLSAWKGAVLTLVALVVVAGCMIFDITGFETRVPDQEDVAAVSITGLKSFPSDVSSYYYPTEPITDPEIIQSILALHTAITETDATEGGDTTSCWITYTCHDGSTITRNYYNIPISLTDLEDETSLTALAQEVLNYPTFIANLYQLDSLAMENEQYTLKSATVTLSDMTTDHSTISDFYISGTAQLETLLAAVHADFEEGNLGARYLFTADEAYQENTYASNILTFYFDYKDDAYSGDVPVTEAVAGDITYSTRFDITLTPQATHTISYLKELGLINEDYGLRITGQ